MSIWSSIHLKSGLFATVAFGAVAASGAAWAQTKTFDVPAQPATTGVAALARQADAQILISAADADGKRVNAVRGSYPVAQALTLLLSGTGLTAQATGSQTYTVVKLPQPQEAQPEPQQTITVDEVLVTAQRRNEQLKDVPVAVTALSAKDLNDQRILSTQDVARVTPGLTMAAFSYQAPNISMRGANNSFSQIGVDRPVAIVLDDVFISRPSGAVFNLYDLDSVQVLRGPQGTLFGRNVTGGAIVLTTRKPSFTASQYSGSIGYGNYDQVEANALVSAPINDSMAIKFVASHTSHDGYGYDRLSGRSQDDLNNTNFRAQLRARAGDFETLFSADYSWDKNGGRTLSSLAAGSTGDPRISSLGVNQFFKRRMEGVSNTTTWTIPGDKGTLTAITAYRTLDSQEVYSTAGASYLFLTAGSQGVNNDTAHVNDFTEEVRYTSPKWGWGDFIAGVYYLHNDAEQPLLIRSYAARTGTLASSTNASQAATTKSISGYIDGNINLPANFRLTVGGRYTSDAKTASLDFVNNLNARASFNTGKLSRDFDQFTPRAVLSWKPNSETLVYASVAKGFTSGGFATGNTTLVAVQQGFQPEKVTNYEAGLKSAILDRRITANLAIFKMDFENKQEFVFNSLTGIGNITNAAQARSKGAEVEVGLHPVLGLDINLTYAAMRSRYDSFVVPGLLNYTGNSLAYSPRNKASATVRYERPIANLGFVIANASYTWTDTYTISASTTQLAVPAFDLTNASIAYETPDRRYRFVVWGKNLFNKEYELNATTTGTLAQWYGAPRTFGATASAKF